MPCYVIRCNDALMRVVIGSQKAADDIAEDMAKAEFSMSPQAWNGDYKTYRNRMYWRAVEVPAEIV